MSNYPSTGGPELEADEAILTHTASLLARGDVHHLTGCRICDRFWRLPLSEQYAAINEAQRRVGRL